MKRIVLLTVGVAALAFSGLAVAHATFSHSIKGVSSTFTATTVSNLRTSSCVGAEGNPFTYTRATYSGTAISTDPTLNGPVTLDLSSYINTTTGYGTVAGKLRITTANNGHTDAHIDGVASHNAFAGLAAGRVDAATWLLANVSADFAPATGVANGKLGGTAGGDAVEGVPGRCSKPSPPKPERIHVVGNATAASGTSISAVGVTCAVPADLASFVQSHVAVGTRVDLKCVVSNGTPTLTHIAVRGGSASSHVVHAPRQQ
jgi:hypothetical protein